MILTAEDAREFLSYDPETGALTWKVSLSNCMAAGKVAGSVNRRYICISINRRMYLAHRVIWLLHHGRWPDGQIDHINGDGKDNRIENLRIATSAQNAANRRRYSNNTCGFKGVSREDGRWLAKITRHGRRYRIGTFDTPELAHAAYRAKALALNGEFARTE